MKKIHSALIAGAVVSLAGCGGGGGGSQSGSRAEVRYVNAVDQGSVSPTMTFYSGGAVQQSGVTLATATAYTAVAPGQTTVSAQTTSPGSQVPPAGSTQFNFAAGQSYTVVAYASAGSGTTVGPAILVVPDQPPTNLGAPAMGGGPGIAAVRVINVMPGSSISSVNALGAAPPGVPIVVGPEIGPSGGTGDTGGPGGGTGSGGSGGGTGSGISSGSGTAGGSSGSASSMTGTAIPAFTNVPPAQCTGYVTMAIAPVPGSSGAVGVHAWQPVTLMAGVPATTGGAAGSSSGTPASIPTVTGVTMLPGHAYTVLMYGAPGGGPPQMVVLKDS